MTTEDGKGQHGGQRPGAGRPKGSTPPLPRTISVKSSPEYEAWLDAFAERFGVTKADLVRSGLRREAQARRHRKPPEL